MRVDVRLNGALRRFRPAEAGGAPHHMFAMEIPPKSTVATLVADLELSNLDGLNVSAVAVNGEAVDLDWPLRDGDQIILFPPVAGGRTHTQNQGE